MTSFIFLLSFVVLISCGVLFLFARMVWQWLWPGMRHAVTIEEFRRTRINIEIGSEGMKAFPRVFGSEDIDAYSVIHPGGVRKVAKERKTLALVWLKRTQQQVGEFIKVYMRLTPCLSEQPNLRTEIQNAFCYLRFMMVCWLLRAMVYMRGPAGCRQLVKYTFSTGDKVRQAARLRLDCIDPTRLTPAEARKGS